MLPNPMLTGLNLSNYLRVSKAAAILGVHADTLRRWEKSGKIITHRHPMNDYRLYQKEDLEKHLVKKESYG